MLWRLELHTASMSNKRKESLLAPRDPIVVITNYYGVIGNRDHIKIAGEKRPFWEFLDVHPDGWLTSLAYRREDLPKDRPMIYDCGAWSYKDEETPPMNSTEIAEAYKAYAPVGSMVIAPDHMLIDGADIPFRRMWNKVQAKNFLIDCPKNLTPMAAVHGMDLEERIAHASYLVKAGYEHLAIGGLAARASQKSLVVGMVAAIRKAVPGVYLHVLGLSSPDFMRKWGEIGIQSADGSSHFKQAFTGGAFYTQEGDRLVKHQAARPGEDLPDDMPVCDCLACSKMRDEGIDTRTYGSNENNMGRAAHNMNILMRAQKVATRKRFVLVSCCGQKLSTKAKAEDLYQSELFRKSKEWALKNGEGWAILSAKHGLVLPDAQIEPYDLTLNDMPQAERNQWSEKVWKQLCAYRDRHLVVLAGNKYCEWITPDFSTERPLAGLGIGQQLAWFVAQNEQAQVELGLE